MSEQCLVIDAWIREAQEVSILVEDIESRIKNKNLELELELGDRLKEIAKSKLFEVGIKLDRLESLLHNPPSKPIFVFAELKKMWNSDGKCYLTSGQEQECWLLVSIHHHLQRGGLPATNTTGSNEPSKSDEQGHMNSFSKDDSEILKPLISKDATQSHELPMKQSGSCIPMSGINKICWIICLILGAAALLVLLVILCAAI